MSSEEFTQELDNFKVKKPATGLAEKIEQKKLEEQAALAKIFTSQRGAAPAAPVIPLNEDVKKAPPAPAPNSPAVNPEHEPKNVAWRQTTLQQLVALYPARHAISDLIMTINGALQQPNMAYALLGPTGTKFLIKSENGALFLADPEKDGAAFANIGLQPDFDKDATDDKDASSRIKPLQGTTPISTVKHTECNEFEIGESFEEKLSEAHVVKTEDVKDPKVRAVVEKLRAMAADIRSGKRSSIDEDAQPSIDVRTLNNALFVAQSLFNKSRNKLYDEIADDLSDAIAECLLSNNNAVLMNRISDQALSFIKEL